MSQIIESAPRAFRNGIESLKKGNTEKGVKRIESAISDGFKPATIFLDIYLNEKDVNQSVKLFEELMDKGFSTAALTIGRKYYTGDQRSISPEESVKWFLESARDGGVEACNYIGEMRENGNGLPLDLKKAWEWYERGAERGDIIAKFNYGRLLRSGDGGYKDLNEAVDNWYESAKGGYGPAMF